MAYSKQNPGWRAGASGVSASEQTFHVQNASAEPLLQRLEGIQKAGNGWRAKCPACGGHSRKVAIAERDGKVLLHCFGGCLALSVLEAVGLTWADIMPPRTWPESPEERRRVRQAMREAGWASALEVLALEARVALIAARQLVRWQCLSEDDDARLVAAVERIEGACTVLSSKDHWRPPYMSEVRR